MTDQIMKADPGWYVARYRVDEGGVDRSFLDPILAWDIEVAWNVERYPNRISCHHVTPITVSGSPDNSILPWAIKRPEGDFRDADGSFTWSAEAGVIADFKKIYENLPRKHEATRPQGCRVMRAAERAKPQPPSDRRERQLPDRWRR